MRSFLRTPKEEKTVLQIAKWQRITVDEYIRRHGFPHYVKYPAARDDN